MSQAQSQRRRSPWWLTAGPALVLLVGLGTAVVAWITGRPWPEALVVLIAAGALTTLLRPLLTRRDWND